MVVSTAFIPRGGLCFSTDIGPFRRVEERRVTGRGRWLIRRFRNRAAGRVPWVRFLPPLSEPGVPISGTGLSSGIMRLAHGLPGHDQRTGLASPGTRLAPLGWPAGASSGLLTPWRRRPLGSSPSLVHVVTSGVPAHLRGDRPSATPVSLLPFAITSTRGPFPPPALPGFLGTYGPLRHPDRPDLTLAGCPLARATPPAGLPVLRPSPSSTRAAASTPAEPVGAPVARFPTAGSLPRYSGGSASALPVSRPARRSFALRPAWSLNRPKAALCRRSASADVVTSIVRFRLLPAGATVAGRDSHPLRNGAFSRRTE